MNVPGAIFSRLALFVLGVADVLVPLHGQQNFSLQLSQGGLTSAGIFDANGRLCGHCGRWKRSTRGI